MAAILIAEDDAISALFLEQALSPSAAVARAADGFAALALAQRKRFDLLIVDVHLLGLDGPSVLARLRADPQAASHPAPALAVSAELDAQTLCRLAAAGFDEALRKPLSITAIREAVERWLEPTAPVLLEDHDALAALGGRSDLLRRMRALLRAELPPMRQQIAAALAAGRIEEARGLLHRLRSACGFCGASALLAAVERLERVLLQGLRYERALLRFFSVATALESELAMFASDQSSAPPSGAAQN